MTFTAKFAEMQDQSATEMMERTPVSDIQERRKTKLIFGVDDKPPIHIALFYGLQVTTLFQRDEYPLSMISSQDKIWLSVYSRQYAKFN